MSETEFAENNADGEEPTMEEILSSIRRIISDDDTPATEEAEVAEVEEDDDDDEILELTEILAEEDPSDDFDEMAALMAADEEDDGLLSPDDIDDLEFSAPEEVAVEEEPEPTPEPVAMEMPELAISESLISAQVGVQVNENFNLLANTMLAQNGAGQTVESMVMALMRPMLKSWLDENLPVMVEKIVREEIERVARGGKI